MWGNWRLDKDDSQLILLKSLCPGEEAKDLYKIDLVRCNTSAAVLDIIVQMSLKMWVTREDIGHLVEALDDLFNLQVNYCGSEYEHSDGSTEYARRILQNRLL